MTEIDRDNDRYKNDKDITWVLYGRVWGFWGGRCIIITTELGVGPITPPHNNVTDYRNAGALCVTWRKEV